MDVRQLRQFIAIAEAGSLTRAAEQLGMAQPPLTMSLRKLEEELGAPLFTRHVRGVHLTTAGHAILSPAIDIVRRLNDLRQSVTDTGAGQRGRLRIGFVGSASYSFLPRLVREFRAQYPLAELLLEEMASQQAVLRVENGTIDLGIIRLPMLQDAKVALITATTEPMMLLVPLDHPLAARSNVDLEACADEDFIMYDLATAANMRAVSIVACQEAGFVPRVVQNVAQIHSLIALVESGMGIAIVPASVRRTSPERGRFLPLRRRGRSIDSTLGIVVGPDQPAPVARRFCAVARAESVPVP